MKYRLYRNLPRTAGAILLAIGLIGDGLDGLLLFSTGVRPSIFWHVLLALLWAWGVNLLAWQGQARKAVSPNRWGLTALLLGMGTFPGLGMSACTIAFLLARCLFASSQFSHALAGNPESGRERELEEVFSPHEMVLSPFVDDLREDNTEARRAVVAKLSRSAHPDTTRLLRQLLSDATAEIRSDASIALTCLDEKLAQALHQSFARWHANPGDIEYTLAFIHHCHRYATSNVLDTKSQRVYLVLARDLLLEVLAGGKREEAQAWLKLADIRQRLGEVPRALQDALHAVHMQPEDREASLLTMDLALRCHAWDILLTLLEQHAGALPGLSAFLSSQRMSTCSEVSWSGL